MWSVEAVERQIEFVVMHAARRVRRGRWLMMVCDGSLFWRPASGPLAARSLVWEAGLPVRASVVAQEGPALVQERSVEARRASVDVGAYDRLLVLSAELRRLVVADPGLKLRLATGEVLEAAEVSAELALF